MIHIALLTLDFPPQAGGVQAYLSELFQRIARQHQVTVITPVNGDEGTTEPFRRLDPAQANVLGNWRALRHLQPDRIVVGHAHPQLLLPAALYHKVPYLALTYGNDYLAAQTRWHRRLFNSLLGGAQPLVTITRSNVHSLRALGVNQQARVIYPGADPHRFRPGAWTDERSRILLTVGRLVPRKGIDTVLRALPTVRRHFPDIDYWIAGSGPDRTRLEALVKELKLDDHVRFLGRVPDEALPDLYRRAGVFVMPVREEAGGTSIEGFGIVYLEASASGLPVVAGASGGASEAVRDGETGIVVEPHAEAVTAALLRLLRDPSLSRRLGASGRRWVESEMHWDRAAREMAEALALHGS